MFALIRDRQRFNENAPNCAVYACTVGLRPSHARYYLNEMQELRKLLKNLQDKSISANRSYSTTDLTLLDTRSSSSSIPMSQRRRAADFHSGDLAGTPEKSNKHRFLEGLKE